MVILFSIFVGLLRFYLEAHAGFNLGDEGYLWYGVQQVLRGETPIRDFSAYDPGRYYWAALLLKLFHAKGIIAVRAVTLAFSVIGLIVMGWLVLQGNTNARPLRLMYSTLAITLGTFWMIPWWKIYDATISLALVFGLAFIFKRPTPRRFFWHGIIVGLAAVFGRNHGVYGVAAFLLAATAYVHCDAKPVFKSCIPAWLAGIAAGFSPVVLMTIIVPGFATSFLEGIHYMLFELRSTNIYLPIPWPWLVHGSSGAWEATLRHILVGGGFIFLPIFCIVGATTLVRSVWHERAIANPVFAACIFTAIPYMNVAFSRADISHLAQAILPATVGIFVLPGTNALRNIYRLACIPLFTLVSVFVTLPMHPAYVMRTEGDWREVSIRGARVWMDPNTAATVAGIQNLAEAYLTKDGETTLAVPIVPAIYALLGVRAPIWEIYPLTHRSELFQRKEIARLRATNTTMVLLDDIALDGRDDLRYENTHPIMWQYIVSHYHPAAHQGPSQQLKMYLPNTASPKETPIKSRPLGYN